MNRYHILNYRTIDLSTRLGDIRLEEIETQDPHKLQELHLEKKAIINELQHRHNRDLEAVCF